MLNLNVGQSNGEAASKDDVICASQQRFAIASLKIELKTGIGFSSYGAIVEWVKKIWT
ncbi:MAG: hypothetical protein PUP92_22695 [Rhizonema sp. PD38]|nr:hypothetical protein [Rhizonema sp. PD38]